MTFKKNNTINREEPKVFFWALLLVIVVCLFSYGYFVRSAIVNIVDRQAMEKEIAVLSSKVITLESEYVRAKNNVTMELAQNSGFITVSTQKFVAKAQTSASGLSVNR